MNRVKKLFTSVVSLMLIIGMLGTGYVFADSSETQKNDKFNTKEYEAFLAEYMQDEMFLEHYNSNPEDAIEMVRNLFEREVKANNRGAVYPGIVATVSTTLTQQPNSYTCGPTSGYMALYGLGVANSIFGSTVNAKINTLASNMGTDSSGTMVYMLRNGLNLYAGSGSYSYQTGSSMGFSGFRSKVFFSLDAGYIPILHADTTTLSYYSNHTCYHYIAIQSFDTLNDTMTLYDCHNNNAYYGAHTVSANNAYSAISASGRYLIFH